MIKTDNLGDTIWIKTFGSEDYDDIGTCVRYTADQGYIIAGYKMDQLIPSGTDLQIIKADSDGELEWLKTFDNSVREFGQSVRQTADGGFIIAGSINLRIMEGVPEDEYDVYLIKTDSSGTGVWTKTYQNNDQSFSNCVQQTSDGGYVIAGRTGSFTEGIYEAYLLKTDSSGTILWTETFGGSGFDEANCVMQTMDGGYLIAGHTDAYDSSGAYDIFLIRTNASGKMLWKRVYGGPYNDYCTSVNLTSDEGYIIAGYTESFGAGSFDAYLLRTSSSGDTLWTKTYGGTGFDQAHSVQQTGDGGYIFAGSTDSKGAGGKDVYLVKTNESGIVTALEDFGPITYPVSFYLAQNVPNPFHKETVISYHIPLGCEVELSIYSVLGQRVAKLISGRQPMGTYQVEWDASSFAGGVYFYRLVTDKGFSQSRKLVLEK